MVDDQIKPQLVNAYVGVGKIKFAGILENDFISHYQRRYLRHVRASLIIGTVFFLFAGLLDMIIAQEKVLELWQVRYQYFLPLLLLIVVFLFSNKFILYQQHALVALIVLSALCMLAMSVVTEGVESEIYFTGMLLTEMAGLTATRMLIRAAVISTLCIVSAVIIVYSQYSPVQSNMLLANLFLLIAVCFISLLSNYNHERAARKNYLRRRLLHGRQEALREANKHLQDIASSDALTGIANRRIFDDSILDEWKRAYRGQYPITLFMVDVDFFKRYNDSYGHQAGDECLKKIAAGLETFCRRPGDKVARYGGEEFALIMPNMALDDAIQVGLEICHKIKSLAIPHASSLAANVVTVSVGIASQVPNEDMGFEKLIRMSDQNLYEAKGNGRNQPYPTSIKHAA